MVLPLRDVNPARRVPYITYLLIAANVVVFLLMPAISVCELQAFFVQHGAIPAEMMRHDQLSSVPGPNCEVGPPGYQKDILASVFTSLFLHGGWLHLLGNMLFLWIFGNNVEDRMGHIRFLLFYLIAGYAAAYGFALADPDLQLPLIGASGAVSGVLGAYFVLYPWARVWSLVVIVPLPLPAWLVLGVWFVLQWFYSTGFAVSEGTVAYLAHIIGFLLGVVVALPLRARRRRVPEVQ